MTQEEYATICRIVTEGFVELSVEILALEAHLAGTQNTVPTSDSNGAASSSVSQGLSLNSPEHAQLIRAVQLLEKEKLALTVQGQKWVLSLEEQQEQDQKDRDAELAADRVIATNSNDANSQKGSASDGGAISVVAVEKEVEPTEGNSTTGTAQSDYASLATGQDQVAVKLSVEEWQAKLNENRDRYGGVEYDNIANHLMTGTHNGVFFHIFLSSLNQVIEDINDKLADIQEAIAVIVL